MEQNPYQLLADLMRDKTAGAPVYRIGRVLATDPLKLDVAGTVQQGNVYINAALARGAARTVSLSGSMSISGTNEGISGTASGSGMTLRSEGYGVTVGDDVLLLSGDDQIFILICKVVRA